MASILQLMVTKRTLLGKSELRALKFGFYHLS